MDMYANNTVAGKIGERAMAEKSNAVKMRGENVNVFYGEKQALFDVNLYILEN